MNRLFILALLAFTTACATNTKPYDDDGFEQDIKRAKSRSSDGFYFIYKEYENTTPGVEFVLIGNKVEWDRIRRKELGIEWETISAFTKWNEEAGTCKIYIKDPAWKYEPELIGHEVAHCIWGRWHKENKGVEP